MYLLLDKMWRPYPDDVLWDVRREAGGVVAQYFDAALYFRQSGERSVWFRLPCGLGNALESYVSIGSDMLKIVGDDLLLCLIRDEEAGEGTYIDTDPTPWLSELLPLRDALIAGDMRALQIDQQATVGVPIDYAALGIDQTTLPAELHALEKFLTQVP